MRLYYRIVETENYMELYASADKAEVMAEVGLSKRVHKKDPQRYEVVQEWEERMRNYGADKV